MSHYFGDGCVPAHGDPENHPTAAVNGPIHDLESANGEDTQLHTANGVQAPEAQGVINIPLREPKWNPGGPVRGDREMLMAAVRETERLNGIIWQLQANAPTALTRDDHIRAQAMDIAVDLVASVHTLTDKLDDISKAYKVIYKLLVGER